MGHLYIINSARLYSESGVLLNSSYIMSDTYNNASRIVNDNTYLDAVIRGLLVQSSEAIDTQMDPALWNQLFRYYFN